MTEELTAEDRANLELYNRLSNAWKYRPSDSVKRSDFMKREMGERYESVRKYYRIRARVKRDADPDKLNDQAREFRKRHPEYNAWQQVNKRRRQKGKRPVSIEAYLEWREKQPKRKDGRVVSRR